MIIFDCNGVLVDSEPIAAAVLADSFKQAGVTISADTVMRRFHGRRPADIFVAVEAATGKELRPIPHAAHALTWLRGTKAVAPPRRSTACGLALKSPACCVSSSRGCSRQATCATANRRPTFS